MRQTCHILRLNESKRRMQENNRWVSLENVTTATANVEEFHPSFRSSLLRLEKHRILRLALGTSLIGPRKSWIRSNILSHASRFTSSVAKVISEDAGGGGFFGVLTGSAGKLEAVGVRIFFWVEHVRTFTAETESDLFQVLLWLFARA